MIKGAFSKDRLISIIRDFIFYPNNPEKEEVIICRYPQYFAANKMLINLKNHIKPKGDGKGGIYFGATGSGKTYTMLYLSRLLMTHERDIFNNPTIVIITDRDDLENQTTKVFASAKEMLKEKSVRSIETRADLYKTLKAQESGGIYITTIQKFCEDTGLLSNRSNIICISDEAHRSQTNIGGKLKTTSSGVVEKFGFAEYLRRSFPNATYCGFTGTPTDDAINVFGPVVDSYTMRESTADGITVRISYEPRMAKVILSDEDLKKIKEYYNKCEAQGANPAQIEESKKAMSTMSAILGHPDRIKKIAKDIAEHYTNLCAQKPEIVQKAMIVCNDRKTAFKLYKEIVSIKPD
ncbi:MAG: DEAD/DEAH box helicase family protein [Mycoplasmoidaceae bacterium]|nr:DEAD/DEAH box helicase family protein [Mycoplasmoidaceae bacterium]